MKTLEDLIGWLEKQPPNSKYDYCDQGYCLFAQFLGREVTISEVRRVTDLTDAEIDFISLVAGSDDERMGPALQRAYKIRDERDEANGQFGVGA